jgi:hypothetical protein
MKKSSNTNKNETSSNLIDVKRDNKFIFKDNSIESFELEDSSKMNENIFVDFDASVSAIGKDEEDNNLSVNGDKLIYDLVENIDGNNLKKTNIKEENIKCIISTKATSIKDIFKKADDNVNLEEYEKEKNNITFMKKKTKRK